jgi:hypothetical protein
VPDVAAIDKNFAKRLASTMRRLTSNMPGEVDAAKQALLRILQSANKNTIFGVAERIENESNDKLSEAEMKDIFDAGVEQGKKLSAQARTQQAYPQMPSAYTMAMFCFQRMDRLDDKHHNFIEKMARTTRRYTPSSKQQAYLEDLYLQLGGGI